MANCIQTSSDSALFLILLLQPVLISHKGDRISAGQISIWHRLINPEVIGSNLALVNFVSVQRKWPKKSSLFFVLGDFAYDFNNNNGHVGDDFMRQIEPVAAYVPYMTAVGNHEVA